MTGDTKLILQGPVSSSVVPSPKRRLSGGSESPGKKLSSPSVVAKERRSVTGGTETVRKEDVNGLMQAVGYSIGVHSHCWCLSISMK